MKEAKNNEIDLMLRSLARRKQGASADHSLEGGASAVTQGQQHLDADELNSYAENALPASARARYTEHLADCSMCRKVAAQLNLAWGASLHPSAAEKWKPSGLRKFLSVIFSAPVMRFAVPAFALIAIMAVALIVNRQQSRRELVASNEPSARSPVSQNQELKVSDSGVTSPEKRPAESGRMLHDSAPTNTAVAQEREQAKAENKPRVEDSQKTVKEPVSEERSSDVKAPPATAPTSAAEPATPKELAANEVSETRDLAKQKRQPEVAGQVGGSKKEADEPHKGDQVAANQATPKKTENLPVSRTGVQGLITTDSGRRARAEKSGKDKAETRLVAGHRFLKEGSGWVDAAYDSSRPTVTLTRGSEQYRALVADEPEIRTMAEQLDGQIIIAWKGRTYKIR